MPCTLHALGLPILDRSLALQDALLENDAHTLLMQHMGRLDEADEEDALAIHATLATFESMLQVWHPMHRLPSS